jgi:hypothetical protein
MLSIGVQQPAAGAGARELRCTRQLTRQCVPQVCKDVPADVCAELNMLQWAAAAAAQQVAAFDSSAV